MRLGLFVAFGSEKRRRSAVAMGAVREAVSFRVSRKKRAKGSRERRKSERERDQQKGGKAATGKCFV